MNRKFKKGLIVVFVLLTVIALLSFSSAFSSSLYFSGIFSFLSPQESQEESTIKILNPQSYPELNSNWTVRFETTKTANLTITAVNGTEFNKDLEFGGVKCGNEIQNYEWAHINNITNSILIPDYYCNETGYEISRVLTTGRHYLEFNFGGEIAYAKNLAGGTPSATLSFFISSEGFFISDKGPTGYSYFNEVPIQMNDYGETTEKCELWDCTLWETNDDKQGQYCKGGWNCTNWNGVTCETYKCEEWALSGLDTSFMRCNGGWECMTWEGSYCEFWNCTNWLRSADLSMDEYCTGIWNCTNWNGGVCDNWNCTEWTQSLVAKEDAYCSGLWDCTSWDAGGNCGGWNCTEWTENLADDKFDAYCSGVWNCSLWNGNYCERFSHYIQLYNK